MSFVIARMIEPALERLPDAMDSPEARVMLVAIGLQESRFLFRYQIVNGKPGVKGPARGYWQFERGGGCAGVLRHATSRFWMHRLCLDRGCRPDPTSLWVAIENDDVLAAGAARLLLFTDPPRLPAVGDVEGAWQLYLRTWRPGAYARDPEGLRDKWERNYQRAVVAVVDGGPEP